MIAKSRLSAAFGLVLLLGILPAVWFVATAARGSAGEAGVPQIGSPAPDFQLLSLEGEQVRLQDLRGHPVLVNFWATWCGPCRAEMPEIERLYQEYQSRGLVVLAIDVLEEEGPVQGYVRELGLTFPVLLDPSGIAIRLYAIAAIPTTFFVDRDGVVREITIGAMTAEVMSNKLSRIL